LIVVTTVDVAEVGERARAAALLSHPLRTRILALARDAASATEMAARLGLPRQRVNYHVRQLARARFLRRAGRVRKRNLIEQRYVASAHAYVLAPGVLGPVAAGGAVPEDTLSAARLVSLAGQAQHEVVEAMAVAAGEGKRLATLSLAADIRFESADQRAAFTAALQAALTDIVGRFTSADRTASGAPATGRPFRLFVACYPAAARRD
jgi:DNA-binding transcriptional ArsR family regulator